MVKNLFVSFNVEILFGTFEINGGLGRKMADDVFLLRNHRGRSQRQKARELRAKRSVWEEPPLFRGGRRERASPSLKPSLHVSPRANEEEMAQFSTPIFTGSHSAECDPAIVEGFFAAGGIITDTGLRLVPRGEMALYVSQSAAALGMVCRKCFGFAVFLRPWSRCHNCGELLMVISRSPLPSRVMRANWAGGYATVTETQPNVTVTDSSDYILVEAGSEQLETVEENGSDKAMFTDSAGIECPKIYLPVHGGEGPSTSTGQSGAARLYYGRGGTATRSTARRRNKRCD